MIKSIIAKLACKKQLLKLPLLSAIGAGACIPLILVLVKKLKKKKKAAK